MTAGPKCEVENSMQDESVGFVFALQSHLRTFRCVQAECFFPTCMLFSTECKVKHKIMTRWGFVDLQAKMLSVQVLYLWHCFVTLDAFRSFYLQNLSFIQLSLKNWSIGRNVEKYWQLETNWINQMYFCFFHGWKLHVWVLIVQEKMLGSERFCTCSTCTHWELVCTAAKTGCTC